MTEAHAHLDLGPSSPPHGGPPEQGPHESQRTRGPQSPLDTREKGHCQGLLLKGRFQQAAPLASQRGEPGTPPSPARAKVRGRSSSRRGRRRRSSSKSDGRMDAGHPQPPRPRAPTSETGGGVLSLPRERVPPTVQGCGGGEGWDSPGLPSTRRGAAENSPRLLSWWETTQIHGQPLPIWTEPDPGFSVPLGLSRPGIRTRIRVNLWGSPLHGPLGLPPACAPSPGGDKGGGDPAAHSGGGRRAGPGASAPRSPGRIGLRP